VSAKFRAVNEKGETLQFVDLDQARLDPEADDFVGPFPLPVGPFRLVVSGLDNKGQHYQRVFPSTVRAQSVEVGLDPATASGTLAIGTATTFRGTIRNLGGPASFRVQAVATPGAVATTVPDVVAVATGEVEDFVVTVTVPAAIPEGTEILLVATATSLNEATLTNSYIVDLTASQNANRLPMADAGADQTAVVGSVVRLDGSRSADPDNGPDQLSFSWTQVDGPEAVVLAGATTATPSFSPNGVGTYEFALIVSDGESKSFSNGVRIAVGSDRFEVPATVPRYSGSARGIGRGAEAAGVRIVGRFEMDPAMSFDCASTVATLDSVIREAGSGKDVAGLPLVLVLAPDPRNTATTCYYRTAVGTPPITSLVVHRVVAGVYNFRLSVSEATVPSLDTCPSAELRTSFVLEDGFNPPVAVATTRGWICFGTGNQYLRER
jgi:hypothetical protein